MILTKCRKAVVWAAVSLCLTAVSVWIVTPLHATEEIVSAYLRSSVLLFCVACCVFGTGVYSFIGFTRRRKEHRAETWFLLAVGAVLLLLSVIIILRFGGITEGNFDSTANAAVNLNVGVCSVLPLPFAVRTWVLAATTRFTKKQRGIALAAAVIVAVVYVALVFGGKLFFSVPYTAE